AARREAVGGREPPRPGRHGLVSAPSAVAGGRSGAAAGAVPGRGVSLEPGGLRRGPARGRFRLAPPAAADPAQAGAPPTLPDSGDEPPAWRPRARPARLDPRVLRQAETAPGRPAGRHVPARACRGGGEAGR